MAKRKAPEQHQSEAWNELPWRKLEKHVSRIQTRIYRAKQAGKTRAVHKLQKLLMRIGSCKAAGSTKGNARQPGEKDSWCRRSEICQASTPIDHG